MYFMFLFTFLLYNSSFSDIDVGTQNPRMDPKQDRRFLMCTFTFSPVGWEILRRTMKFMMQWVVIASSLYSDIAVFI